MGLILKKTFTPRFVDSFFNNDWFADFGLDRGNTVTPAVNVVENNDEYIIEVAAPGFSKNDFHIDIDKHVLAISSEKEEKEETNTKEFVRREFGYCAFRRSFSLPELVKEDKIKATYENGVLYVSIPKMDEAKDQPAREIKIA